MAEVKKYKTKKGNDRIVEGAETWINI